MNCMTKDQHYYQHTSITELNFRGIQYAQETFITTSEGQQATFLCLICSYPVTCVLVVPYDQF